MSLEIDEFERLLRQDDGLHIPSGMKDRVVQNLQYNRIATKRNRRMPQRLYSGLAAACMLCLVGLGTFDIVNHHRSSTASDEGVLQSASDKHEQAIVNKMVSEAGKKNVEQLNIMLKRDAEIMNSVLYDVGPPYGTRTAQGSIETRGYTAGMRQLQQDYKTFELMFPSEVKDVHAPMNQNLLKADDYQDKASGMMDDSFLNEIALVDSAYQSALMVCQEKPLSVPGSLNPRSWSEGHKTLAQSMQSMEIPDIFARYDNLWFGGKNAYVPSSLQ